MLASAIPYKIPQPFAAGNLGTATVPIPNTAQPNGYASWPTGWQNPPNATDPGAGGIPPIYADFQGLFYIATAWLQWAQAGGFPINYDATFQTTIGGYPNGAVVGSIANPGLLWRSTADNNTSNPDAGGANWTRMFRIPLFGGGTFTVNYSTGVDSPVGGTSGAPWKTPQYAANFVQQFYDLCGQTALFNCSGAFPAGVNLVGRFEGQIAPGNVIFSFSGGSSVNNTNGIAFSATFPGCGFRVQCLTGTTVVQAGGTGNLGIALNAELGGIIEQGIGLNFAACGTSIFRADYPGSIINHLASFNISGSAALAVWNLNSGATALAVSPVVATYNGALSYTTTCLCAGGSANLAAVAQSLAGGASVTGQRYNVTNNGVISVPGGGANFFPGSTPGTTNLVGGVYSNGSGQYIG